MKSPILRLPLASAACLLCLATLSCQNTPTHAAPDIPSPAQLELTQAFTVHGKPVHPRAVDEMLPWLSCSGPTIFAIDPLAASENPNRYAPAEVTKSDSWVRWNNPANGGQEWTAYRHLGTLRDGTIVLQTAQGGGGSGVFQNLLFLRVQSRPTMTLKENELHPGLMLVLVGMYALGDRDQTLIQVDQNRVLVGGAAVCESQ